MTTTEQAPIYPWLITDFATLVASNVRAEIARAGARPVDIARALGVSRSVVSKKWNGQRPWSLNELEVIAELANVLPSELTREPDIQNRPGQVPGLRLVRQQGLEPRTRWFGDELDAA